MPQIKRIIETALYVDDLERAKAFYSQHLQLEVMVESSVLVAFNVGQQNTLLLFKRGASVHTKYLSGGEIPPHDASGRIHICFAIDAEDLPTWETRLDAADIAIEGRTHWPKGGSSVYFRDPDGNLVDFYTPPKGQQ